VTNPGKVGVFEFVPPPPPVAGPSSLSNSQSNLKLEIIAGEKSYPRTLHRWHGAPPEWSHRVFCFLQFLQAARALRIFAGFPDGGLSNGCASLFRPFCEDIANYPCTSSRGRGRRRKATDKLGYRAQTKLQSIRRFRQVARTVARGLMGLLSRRWWRVRL